MSEIAFETAVFFPIMQNATMVDVVHAIRVDLTRHCCLAGSLSSSASTLVRSSCTTVLNAHEVDLLEGCMLAADVQSKHLV